ncbi:amidase [Microbacterium resistens]|uniref:Amidase n=1 Tax=Microbacterium resistens TaxID=156977 RepID=A0ABU1S907_9MICO|nr:amidase [Microbacterium resistens]MDR6866097.1 amidase [Microbacterium resistens]
MNLSEYASLDATALSEAVARGETTTEELQSLAATAAAAVDPELNAIIELWPDPEPPLGSAPFAGVPMLLKDMGAPIPGRRIELGSRLTAGLVADHRADLADRFRSAGLVAIGRTTIPEFAAAVVTESSATGATRNPYASGRSAGGSSGGSAAAVAAGVVPIAHATDAAGSIRVPAAFTGLVGLKPTRGAVSWSPDPEPVEGLAVPFALTRSVRDARALFDAMTDAPGVPERPGPLRVLVTDGALGARSASPSALRALADVSEALRDAGHSVNVKDIDLGVPWDRYAQALSAVWASSTAEWIDALAAVLGRDPREHLEPQTLALLLYGRGLTVEEMTAARDTLGQVGTSIGRIHEQVDLILSPTTLAPAPLIGEFAAGAADEDGEAWLRRSLEAAPLAAPVNATGTPAVSVPAGLDPETGIPVGVQLWGPAASDRMLLDVAAEIEERLPWGSRRPAIWAGDR